MSSQSAAGSDREERLSRIVLECLEALDRGEPEPRAELLARHPEFAAELNKFLDDQEQVDGCAAPLRAIGNGAVPPVPSPAQPTELGDFRLVREVGRGGMGVVYEAEQVSLGRRVAVKLLPFAGALDPRQLQRFRNEAHAAAQLHHTNIVPVYAVGCERGVHFYAMQFIDGQSLAEVIATLRRQADGVRTKRQPASSPLSEATVAAEAGQTVEPVAPAATRETRPVAGLSTVRPTRDAAYFRTVAQLGIQAAEALDYAHQQGILHRDVKPANLLVDGSSRLWMADFGLAQVQSDTRLTMTGDLVGTLRYMSPEQTLAKRVVVDHRTDLYSLGATLYELLTLESAFDGSDRQELLRQIAFEDPRPLRRVNRRISAELETIVLKAMEKNPADRYATAQDMADDLRHYLEDRPIRARPPSAIQRLRKWGRRHRAAVITGVVSLLAALTAFVGSLGWVLGDRMSRQRAAETIVLEALDQAEPGLKKGDPWDLAFISGARRVEAQLASGVLGPEARQRAEQLLRDMEMLERLDRARLQQEAGVEKVTWDFTGAERLYEDAFRWYGLDVTALDPADAAQRLRASAIGTGLLAGLDHWASVRSQMMKGPFEREALFEVASLADDDPWRRRLRQALKNGPFKEVERIALEEEALGQPPATLVAVGEVLRHPGSWPAAEQLFRRAQEKHPGDFWVNFELAFTLANKNPSDMEGGIRFYQAALAARPNSCVVYNNLGSSLKGAGKLTEAVASFRKAIELQPRYALPHLGLGQVLVRQGLLDEAMAEYRKAIELNPHLAAAHCDLGTVLVHKGWWDEAMAEYREALRLDKDSAEAHNNLGHCLYRKGCPDEAIAEYRQALRVNKDYWEAHNGLGNALDGKGLVDEAITEYREAIRLKKDDADAHYNLGLSLRDKGQLTEAIREWREAIRLKVDHPSALSNVRLAERWVELEAKLPEILTGKASPGNVTERLELARMCAQHKKFNIAAVRFFSEAFSEQPELADNLNSQDRYDAACAAALAGCGQGRDAGRTDDKERAALRGRSVEWLRSDLAAYRRLLEHEPHKAGPLVRERMQHWQQDKDFAGVRGEALSKLPEAERPEWQRLWDEVERLRQRAAAPAKKAGP